MQTPFYNSKFSYDANFKKGPFGIFSDNKKFVFNEKPEYEIFGQKIYFPYGIAAGPLLRGSFVQAAFSKGFPVAVYKTVRSRLYKSQPVPNLIPFKTAKISPYSKVKTTKSFYPSKSATNSYGVPSMSPEFWQEDLKNLLKRTPKGYLVIASFQGTVSGDGNKQKYIDDWVKTAKMVKKTSSKIFEMNWSCPNEGSHELLCFDGATIAKIAKGVRKVLGKKAIVIVKIAYFKDKKLLLKNLKGVLSYIDAVAAINTVPVKSVGQNGNPSFGPGREITGAGGRAIQPLGLEMVKFLDKFRKKEKADLKIIGVGGVVEAKDYHKYRRAGADLVLSATGAIFNPLLAQEIFATI